MSTKVQISEKEAFTHLDKIFWKEEGYTKGDMIEYYRAVAPFILPYLKNHALMMRRYPNGIDKPYFFQKNVESIPQWVHTALIEHEEKKIRYILIQDVPSLLYVANLGSIELHPMIADYKHLQKPEYLVIDLDPEDVPFKKLVDVAQHIHDLLEHCAIPNFCKTSGSRGLHIYVPLHHKYPFEQTEPFAQLLAEIVANQLPDIISLERLPKHRQGRIYIDYLQNLHGGRTMVAPYSLRAKPHATVSTPLLWKEVNANLDPQDFTMKTVPGRLKKIGDPFKDTLGTGINLKQALKHIEKIT